MIIEKICLKVEEGKKEQNTYKADFFRISNPGEKSALEALLNSKPEIKAFDTISAQLKELAKANKPSATLSQAEIDNDIKEILNGTNICDYGVWVYYPWSERLVHILDEKEFIFLRTNRNRYKITESEQHTLYQKKVGVIGLSVGQSVSLTMAMERTFGELRIADFDDLEITNLNRLRSGIHNMGLLKTVLVAREIAEIDPYLKVTCFHDGITEENIEAFLTANGKLDVLIDECDSVDIKIKCRIAAKKHQIPVLMEASDRATIDIERFDLEPERPILHGYIEHLDISRIKEAKTMEEKLPYILPIVGIETMSPRLKASAVEIGQSINTWPQLASAVTLGGGVTADICRRVLLDQLHVSGRYFIDIDELIADPKPKTETFHYDEKPLAAADMQRLAALVPASSVQNAITDEQTIKTILTAAVAAPSAGNNQPWKWYFDGNRLFLFDDAERSAAFANFKGMVSNLAMGAAIENVRLKAKEMGMDIEAQLFPLAGNNKLVASITVKKTAAPQKDPLVAHIHTRHTNRRKGNGAPIEKSILEEIRTEASVVKDISVKFLENADAIKKIADIAGTAEKLRMFIPQGHSDLFDRELRWDKEMAESTRDGLDVRTLDLEPKDIVGFRVIKDPRAIQLVNDWDKGAALENMTRNLVASSSAVGLVTAPAFTPEYCVHAGEAAERAWLVATKHRVGFQPVLASVFHFARLIHGNGAGMPEKIQKKFSGLHSEFIKLFGLSSTSEQPLFLFRLCFADEPGVKSLRLDLEEIYSSISVK
jgi:molybdopterin/thiamine biosynthesis adenylyltransferase